MRQYILIILVLLFSFWTIKPLLISGYFPMHDDTQVARVIAMGRSLREGQFPVRLVRDLGYGYGYPIFNFYGPLPYYFGGLLYSLGISGLAATKIMMMVGMVLAGVTTFVFAQSLFGALGAFLSAIFFLYLPYHAVQLYVRGAVGELWAVAMLPIFCWGVVRLITKKPNGAILCALGLFGVIVSHTILGFITVVGMAGILVVGFLGSLKWPKYRYVVGSLTLAVIWGMALSAFFWLPAIVEMRFTNITGQIGASANFRNHFVCLSQLWDSPWGFGGSTPGCIDGLSFKLGKLHIIGALIGMAIWIYQSRKQTHINWPLYTFGLVMISSGGLLDWSMLVWNQVPGLEFVQYPWRLLSFSGLGLSILAGGISKLKVPQFVRLGIVVVLAGLCVFTNSKLFSPQYIYQRQASLFESFEEIRFHASKISDEYLPIGFIGPKTASEVPHDTISQSADLLVEPLIDTATLGKYHLISAKNQNVRVARAVFPGWDYRVNGNKVEIEIVNGLPWLPIPAGESTIEMAFTDTPIRLFANIITIVGSGFILIIYGKKTIA